MKRIKRATDPARPEFRHYVENSKKSIGPWAKSATDFLLIVAGHHQLRMLRFKVCTWRSETTSLVSITPEEDLEHFLTTVSPEYNDVFFCPSPVSDTREPPLTWFGWCDTGRVHPGIFEPHPVAYWETSKGNYQAIWRWERGIPFAASTARVEAMIQEYGGKLGSHLPDAFLRVPGSINNSTTSLSWPTVRMLYNTL